MPAQGEELRARRFRRSDGAPGLGPAREDRCHVGQRLDVVDDGRLSEEAGDRGERWLGTWLTAAALERVEEGRLFTADVGTGTAAQLDLEALTFGEDGGGMFESSRRFGIFAPQVDERLFDTAGEGRNRHPFQKGERVALEEHAVLERPRFGLVGV